MDQERLVCEGRGISKVKYVVQIAKSTILHEMEEYLAHTPKTSHWEDSAHLAVRTQCNSWSGRQRGNDYFQIKFLTIGVGGGLTGPGGGQTARAYFGRQKSISLAKDFPRFSTDSNLETTQKSLRTKERNGGAHSEFWTTFS
jgi:hypothetical protein